VARALLRESGERARVSAGRKRGRTLDGADARREGELVDESVPSIQKMADPILVRET
jgi:hypothetical protein